MGIENIRRLNAKRTGYAPPESSTDKATPPPAPTAAGLTKFFTRAIEKLTGICQCGCWHATERKKGSVAHIFPKKDFYSVALHPSNWVERAMWGGCHTNMDQKGVEHWPNMADWPDIVAKFHILEPLLTKEEKTKKFYKKLKPMVDAYQKA